MANHCKNLSNPYNYQQGTSCCCLSSNCCCSTLGGIQNIDQGYFHNTGSSNIVNVPEIDLAYLSNSNNSENNNDIDTTINLNPTYIKWCDLKLLFFNSPSGAFYINNSNSSFSAITFNGQTYESTQNKKVWFSLYDQVVKAWSKKNNKPESSIPIPYKIQLERQTFLTKSLSNISGYQLALSLDEIISTLLNKKQIEPGNNGDAAKVKFNISYKDYFCPLDISIIVVFSFITNIPCYKNVNDCDTCPYSNDTLPTRPVFDEDNSDIWSHLSCDETITNTSLGSNTLGSNTLGSNTLDSSTLDSNTLGSNTLGSNSFGGSNYILDRPETVFKVLDSIIQDEISTNSENWDQ